MADPAAARPFEFAVPETFSLRAGKWTLVVVEHLRGPTRRFNELRREIAGISQKTLAETLRALERDGFVLRTLFPTIPPRVEYELTALGRELLSLVDAWRDFAESHRAEVEAARRRFDAETHGRGL